MTNLLSFKYWFNFNPPFFSYPGQIIIIVFLGILFLLGILFMFYRKKSGAYKVLLNDLYVFSLSNFFIGGLFFFFSYQHVHFLSARFWFLLWALLFIFWLISIIKKFRKIIFKRKEREKRKEFEKYLP